jgi:transposase
MEKHSEVFVGLDVAKARHAVAIAEDGRHGEVRYLGEIDAEVDSVRRFVAKLEKRHGKMHFCYEAGPTGYGLYRQLTTLGHDCTVVAPSLIPRKPGDRVKTNRRDAEQLARLLRAGELTAVWVPDEAHEAMRDLVRARQSAVEDIRRKRQAISSMMLRQGRIYPGKKTWGARHAQWLQAQRFDHIGQHLVLQEMLFAVRHGAERLERIEDAIVECLPRWSLAPVVTALQALRGVNMITAVTIMSEVGDLRRFQSPRQLMGYLGLVPSERSTGETVIRLGITKAGNGRVRQALVESAWSYRHPPRTGRAKYYVHENVSPAVRDIAAKAQTRLCGRYRALSQRGKKLTVAVTAIARELAGFVWAIGMEVRHDSPTS